MERGHLSTVFILLLQDEQVSHEVWTDGGRVCVSGGQVIDYLLNQSFVLSENNEAGDLS